MRAICPHIHLAHHLHISNVWLFADTENRHWLIDTGHPLERPWLMRQLARQGIRSAGDLTGILLTHRHSDHAGNAGYLRDYFRCPVYCHADDAPYLNGERSPLRLARGVGSWPYELLCHIEDRWPSTTTIDDTWSSGRWIEGWETVHVPGHTEGSSLLYHEATATLFTGDAILVGSPPFRFDKTLRLAHPAFSLDVDRCRQAVRDFLAHSPPISTLCSGHGPAVLEEAQPRLRKLLRQP